MRIAVITGGMGGLGDSISVKMHAAGYARQHESQGMDLRTQGQRSRIQRLPGPSVASDARNARTIAQAAIF
jgi:hypothetical protein